MKFDTVIAESKNKVIYRDGEKCIKLFDELYSKADVLNEALNHARIEETGLNIPKIHEVTLIDGKWAIILEYIEGKTLAQLMAENPEKKNEYIEILVDLQMEVHFYFLIHELIFLILKLYKRKYYLNVIQYIRLNNHH